MFHTLASVVEVCHSPPRLNYWPSVGQLWLLMLILTGSSSVGSYIDFWEKEQRLASNDAISPKTSLAVAGGFNDPSTSLTLHQPGLQSSRNGKQVGEAHQDEPGFRVSGTTSNDATSSKTSATATGSFSNPSTSLALRQPGPESVRNSELESSLKSALSSTAQPGEDNLDYVGWYSWGKESAMKGTHSTRPGSSSGQRVLRGFKRKSDSETSHPQVKPKVSGPSFEKTVSGLVVLPRAEMLAQQSHIISSLKTIYRQPEQNSLDLPDTAMENMRVITYTQNQGLDIEKQPATRTLVQSGISNSLVEGIGVSDSEMRNSIAFQKELSVQDNNDLNPNEALKSTKEIEMIDKLPRRRQKNNLAEVSQKLFALGRNEIEQLGLSKDVDLFLENISRELLDKYRKLSPYKANNFIPALKAGELNNMHSPFAKHFSLFQELIPMFIYEIKLCNLVSPERFKLKSDEVGQLQRTGWEFVKNFVDDFISWGTCQIELKGYWKIQMPVTVQIVGGLMNEMKNRLLRCETHQRMRISRALLAGFLSGHWRRLHDSRRGSQPMLFAHYFEGDLNEAIQEIYPKYFDVRGKSTIAENRAARSSGTIPVFMGNNLQYLEHKQNAPHDYTLTSKGKKLTRELPEKGADVVDNHLSIAKPDGGSDLSRKPNLKNSQVHAAEGGEWPPQTKSNRKTTSGAEMKRKISMVVQKSNERGNDDIIFINIADDINDFMELKLKKMKNIPQVYRENDFFPQLDVSNLVMKPGLFEWHIDYYKEVLPLFLHEIKLIETEILKIPPMQVEKALLTSWKFYKDFWEHFILWGTTSNDLQVPWQKESVMIESQIGELLNTMKNMLAGSMDESKKLQFSRAMICAYLSIHSKPLYLKKKMLHSALLKPKFRTFLNGWMLQSKLD